VLLIESDPDAVVQINRVMAGMNVGVIHVRDENSLHEAVAQLQRDGMSPALIVARVALPTGSGIRLLEEAKATFPQARELLISHHSRDLLFSVPGFADHAHHFLQEEFSDEEFLAAAERLLERQSGAAQGE
jgi:DNA-binding response OmpR family regulator